MRFLPLILLYGLLSIFSADSFLKFPSAAPATGLKSNTANAVTKAEPAATNIIFQSKDGGQTWQDISSSLPVYQQPEGFFAGESELYLRVRDDIYRTESNLSTLVWEKENAFDKRSASVVFNRSGVMAYTTEGQMYQKKASAGTWVPVYTSFKNHPVETIFETADGTILLGSQNGIYKSADKGRSWKPVKNEGWVMDIAESNGVLIATGQKGIMRSDDKGEHWEWVISEGGVGIAVESVENGFVAISFNSKSNSRRTRLSVDGGKTWKAIDAGLQPSANISSIKQLGNNLFLGHPDGIYQSPDKGETWNLVHPGFPRKDFQFGGILNVGPSTDGRKVFDLYTSGKVLYAVAREAGC